MRVVAWLEPPMNGQMQLTQMTARAQFLDNDTGQPIDLTGGTIQITVVGPGLASVIYKDTGAPTPNIVKDGVGSYHWPFVPTKAGKWWLSWAGATSGTADQGVANTLAYFYSAISG